jgi:putative flippase GtrA
MDSHHSPDSGGRSRQNVRKLASFAAIGVVSTLAYVAIFSWLRQITPASVANLVALVATALGNTAANRRLTFDVRGRDGLARDHAAGMLALGVALLLTTTSLAAMDVLAPHRGRLIELAVLVTANAAATLVRFLLLRLAIDRRSGSMAPAAVVATLSTLERIKG